MHLIQSFCPAVRYNLLCHPEVSGLAQQDFHSHQGYKDPIGFHYLTKSKYLTITRYNIRRRPCLGTKAKTPNRFLKPVRSVQIPFADFVMKIKRTIVAPMEAASLLGKSRNFGIAQQNIAYSGTSSVWSKKVLLLKTRAFHYLKFDF